MLKKGPHELRFGRFERDFEDHFVGFADFVLESEPNTAGRNKTRRKF